MLEEERERERERVRETERLSHRVTNKINNTHIMLRAFSARVSRLSKLNRRFASTYVFEVDTTNFEEKVIQSNVPVILDCYADWCQPCKQLAPLLEDAVEKAGGKVVLAKLDVDKNPPIAQQLQVQSLPTVFGLFEQKLVNKFVGLVDSKTIDSFMDQMIEVGNGSSSSQQQQQQQDFDLENATPEEAFTHGFTSYQNQDFKTALSCFERVIDTEKNETDEEKRQRRAIERQERRAASAAAQGYNQTVEEAKQRGQPPPPPPPTVHQRESLDVLVARAMSLSALSVMVTGDIVRAESIVQELKSTREEEHQNLPDVSRSIALVEINADVQREGDADTNELVNKINSSPDDHQTRLRLAKILASVGEFPSAVDQALEIMKRDRNWNEGEAKAFLLQVFNILGPQHEVSKDGRRRLSNYIL